MDGCPHTQFRAEVVVSQLTHTDIGAAATHTADIRLWCEVCHEPFRALGLQVGFSPARPTTSADGLELRVPIAPGAVPVMLLEEGVTAPQVTGVFRMPRPPLMPLMGLGVEGNAPEPPVALDQPTEGGDQTE